MQDFAINFLITYLLNKIRILHITSTPPIPTWGGSMAFYRHFCERDDFEIMVITDNPQIKEYKVPYQYFLINRGTLFRRITTTRFYKAGHTLGHFFARNIQETVVLEALQKFAPDAVFTVAGSWSWTALLAEKTARKLKIPLIGSFNDWWFYNSIRIKFLDSFLDRQFRNFYKRCDLAICTSEGMQDALGSHPNSVVVYPTGASLDNEHVESKLEKFENFVIVFAGNLGEWYGKMLEQLINDSCNKNLLFKIYGSNATWSPEFDKMVKAKEIYEGQIPFNVLKTKIKKADALILLMGFDKSVAQIEKTSFKTKFLDYISFHKPILLWGPEYCSAVAVAREFDSAEICVSEKASDFLTMIENLINNPARQNALVKNASKMYEERFHPNKIHAVLKNSIEILIQKLHRN